MKKSLSKILLVCAISATNALAVSVEPEQGHPALDCARPDRAGSPDSEGLEQIKIQPTQMRNSLVIIAVWTGYFLRLTLG